MGKPNAKSRSHAAKHTGPVPQEVVVACNGLKGVFQVSTFTVSCECQGCFRLGVAQKPMAATEFERHAGMGTSKKWRRSIKVDGADPSLSLGRWLENHGFPSSGQDPFTSAGTCQRNKLAGTGGVAGSAPGVSSAAGAHHSSGMPHPSGLAFKYAPARLAVLPGMGPPRPLLPDASLKDTPATLQLLSRRMAAWSLGISLLDLPPEDSASQAVAATATAAANAECQEGREFGSVPCTSNVNGPTYHAANTTHVDVYTQHDKGVQDLESPAGPGFVPVTGITDSAMLDPCQSEVQRLLALVHRALHPRGSSAAAAGGATATAANEHADEDAFALSSASSGELTEEEDGREGLSACLPASVAGCRHAAHGAGRVQANVQHGTSEADAIELSVSGHVHETGEVLLNGQGRRRAGRLDGSQEAAAAAAAAAEESRASRMAARAAAAERSGGTGSTRHAGAGPSARSAGRAQRTNQRSATAAGYVGGVATNSALGKRAAAYASCTAAEGWDEDSPAFAPPPRRQRSSWYYYQPRGPDCVENNGFKLSSSCKKSVGAEATVGRPRTCAAGEGYGPSIRWGAGRGVRGAPAGRQEGTARSGRCMQGTAHARKQFGIVAEMPGPCEHGEPQFELLLPLAAGLEAAEAFLDAHDDADLDEFSLGLLDDSTEDLIPQPMSLHGLSMGTADVDADVSGSIDMCMPMHGLGRALEPTPCVAGPDFLQASLAPSMQQAHQLTALGQSFPGGPCMEGMSGAFGQHGQQPGMLPDVYQSGMGAYNTRPMQYGMGMGMPLDTGQMQQQTYMQPLIQAPQPPPQHYDMQQHEQHALQMQMQLQQQQQSALFGFGAGFEFGAPGFGAMDLLGTHHQGGSDGLLAQHGMLGMCSLPELGFNMQHGLGTSAGASVSSCGLTRNGHSRKPEQDSGSNSNGCMAANRLMPRQPQQACALACPSGFGALPSHDEDAGALCDGSACDCWSSGLPAVGNGMHERCLNVHACFSES